jgi:hypothetical protein
MKERNTAGIIDRGMGKNIETAMDPVGDNEKAAAVVADDWKETLKRVGGSQSDDWNHVLGNQAIQSLWTNQSDNEGREKQFNAAIAGLIGIAPQDEIEGMIAAQLIAAHSATMECYRRAMIGEQTLEGRRDNLSQANKLSRTYAVLLDALNRHRGKGGQQKVTVEHVHVHAGGQAVVGVVESPRGGKTDCPCTSAGGVERGQGAGAVAGQRRCRTAAAECTAGCPREPRRVTRMH